MKLNFLLIILDLFKLLGRNIGNYTGNATDVNKQLDARAAQLSTGTYLLKVNTATGKSEVFKVTKQ